MRRPTHAPHGPRRTGRRVRAVAAVLAVVFLAGCRVDAEVDIRAERDGSGLISVVVTADQELVAAHPEIADDLRADDLTAAGWDVTGPGATPDGGMQVTVAHDFATPEDATRLLGQLGGPDGPFRDLELAQVAARTRVETSLTGSIYVPGPEAFADEALVGTLGGVPLTDALAERGLTLADAFDLMLTFVGPGPVEATDGTAAPYDEETRRSTVEWDAALSGAAVSPPGQPVNARLALVDNAARRAARWRDFALWAVPTWVVFFLLVVLPIRFLIRRRR